MPRVEVIGTPVSVSSFGDACETVEQMVDRRAGGYVSCANAYGLCLALDDRAYGEILRDAAFVTADGMSVVWALRALGHRCERVHNDDLFLALCARHPGWRHFLVGGRDGQPQAVAQALAQRVPGLQVVGMHSTPERPVPPATHAAIVGEIAAARPDIVWVGMGTPAQDIWMRAAAPATGVPMVAVGSAFDLLAGRTRAAPDWMKKSGLQWLFRLGQEPRRLAGRYLYYNSRFVTAFARQLAHHVRHR